MVRAVAFLSIALIPDVVCRPAAAQPPQETIAAGVSLTRNEVRLVRAVNAYRRTHGLEPLSVDPVLMRVGRHAAPYYSHRINGKWCWHRAREAGFSGWATDDLANGYLTPEDAVAGWSTSHGHAMQMRGYFKMNGRWRNYNFNRIGVGISGRKYIAIFGRDDSNQKVTGSPPAEERQALKAG